VGKKETEEEGLSRRREWTGWE